MSEIERIDNELYKAIFIFRDVCMYDDIWKLIRRIPSFQKEAVQIKRDKFDERDTVTGITIADTMLKNYKYADKEAYNKLIKSIYSNKDIARTVIDGAANGGYSFLLMSLWNHDVKLTEEQKAFAVNEAMNKTGTVKWKQEKDRFSENLDKFGITDKKTTTLNIDGSINPIGEKQATEYMNSLFESLSNKQAHGIGEYDIRYCILKNPNWSEEEKQKLIYDFWYCDEDYDEYLDQWEWGIINDQENYKGMPLPQLEKEFLYDYSYEDLLNFYNGDEQTAKRIFEEITFCKLMHNLRPQQWEKENYQKRK